MTSVTANTARLAERMLRDYDDHHPGTAFAEGLRLSIDEAYRLQRQVAQLRVDRGERVAGYKIGCICRENQVRHGLSHPVYGRLWDTEQHASGVDLDPRDYANLAVEGEFGVTLRRDIDAGSVSSDAIADAVDEVFTVLELHNLVLNTEVTGPELIANNAIHAGVVRSSGTRPPAAPTPTSLVLRCDGRTVGEWSQRRWPDDVLQELPWLVGELDKESLQLEQGQMILTGAWGPPVPLAGNVEAVSTIFGAVAAAIAGPP